MYKLQDIPISDKLVAIGKSQSLFHKVRQHQCQIPCSFPQRQYHVPTSMPNAAQGYQLSHRHDRPNL